MTGVEDVKPGSLKAWMAFTRPKTWGVAASPCSKREDLTP